MPTYLFSCEENPENPIEYEEFHQTFRNEVECKICKEAGKPNHQPKRLINSQTPGKVELTGHDLVAKTKEDTIAFKKQVQGSEKHYANVLGEGNYQGLQQRIDRQKR